jgi:hypothetical protein
MMMNDDNNMYVESQELKDYINFESDKVIEFYRSTIPDSLSFIKSECIENIENLRKKYLNLVERLEMGA